MSSLTQNIRLRINQYVNQYAVDSYTNQQLRNILLDQCDAIDEATGGTPTDSLPLEVTSADFSDATNCPLTSLDGKNLRVFWNDLNRFLMQGTDWNPLVGGGFTILIPGFNSIDGTYTFYVFS